MRTTVTLDEDIAAAVRQIRRERRLGLSEAVNELARAGLAVRPHRRPFRQRGVKIGLKVDISNVAEAIDVLEGPTAR